MPDLHIDPDPSLLADSGVEVVVDFTVPDATRGNLAWAAANGVHAVVGTTGLSWASYRQIARSSVCFPSTEGSSGGPTRKSTPTCP